MPATSSAALCWYRVVRCDVADGGEGEDDVGGSAGKKGPVGVGAMTAGAGGSGDGVDRVVTYVCERIHLL
jgi:hypothetical protein